MTRHLSALLLMSLAATAPGQTVYKWVMPDGSIRYSDRPQEEGALERQELTIVGAEAPDSARAPSIDPAAGNGAPAEQPAFAGYERFEITSPTPDQAVRDNGGNISIQLALEPALQAEHLIELFMDGQSLGTGRTTGITMTNVDRGTHTIQASIRDESGRRLETTSAVTFSLLRVAAGS